MVEPFIWNYIIENKLDEDDDKDDDNDEDNNDNSTTVVAITLLPMGCKKHKLNDIDPSVTFPDNSDVERLYPYLSCTLGGGEDGFGITNPSVVKSMQALLTELTNFFSSDYELKVKDIAKHGHVICYVRIPITSSDRSFQKDKEWLDAAI